MNLDGKHHINLVDLELFFVQNGLINVFVQALSIKGVIAKIIGNMNLITIASSEEHYQITLDKKAFPPDFIGDRKKFEALLYA